MRRDAITERASSWAAASPTAVGVAVIAISASVAALCRSTLVVASRISSASTSHLGRRPRGVGAGQPRGQIAVPCLAIAVTTGLAAIVATRRFRFDPHSGSL